MHHSDPIIDRFVQSLDRVVSMHRKGAAGTKVALALTARADRLMLDIYRSTPLRAKRTISIVALGGYGRKELCFQSDIDVMFLVPEGVGEEERLAVESLLHRLFDAGIPIGHSVRMVSDCVTLAADDPESWVSLLEGRFLCGNKRLFQTLSAKVRQQIGAGDKVRLTYELLARLDLRHQKYGSSVKLLEPNVKYSAGGLRDLHTILWFALSGGLWRPFGPIPASKTEIEAFLGSAVAKKALAANALKDALQGYNLLLRARNEMHLQLNALHDTLGFALQKQVAKSLGYKATAAKSNVENFMHQYYLAARSISLAALRTAGFIRRKFGPAAASYTQKIPHSPFQLRDGKLAFGPRKRRLNNALLLEAIRYSIAHNAPFSDELEAIVTKEVKAFTPLRTRAETELFRDLLNQSHGVSQSLQKCADCGVLERWIPEWKPMVAFFQHNVYHYYTADEHTLKVVEVAEALSHSSTAFGDVYRQIPRRDVLYLACLLHDIAKPRRIGDHEVVGSRMAGPLLKRLRYEDVLRDVRFLIRHHLTMEQVAFRRDLSDPQTIIDFSRIFKRPAHLDYLYLLTYADLNAVNKNVWTDWKRMLLDELYGKTKEVLDRRLSEAEVRDSARRRQQESIKRLIEQLTEEVDREVSQPHLEAIESPAYLDSFDPGEIAGHIEQIERKEQVSTIVRHQDSYSEITIITKDAPFLLSRLCGVLTANDANIFDAHIFTRNDGIVIDKFRLFDFVSRSALSPSQCAKIEQELRDVISSAINIEHLLQRHKMKWRRRAAPLNPNVRIDIEFEKHPRFTIIDVYAADTMGFLYKVTEAISQLDLDISFAKIATRVDGIVDSFYVRDRSGRMIDDPGRKELVRAELLKTIQHLAKTELVLS